jgi:hypothetical protein
LVILEDGGGVIQVAGGAVTGEDKDYTSVSFPKGTFDLGREYPNLSRGLVEVRRDAHKITFHYRGAARLGARAGGRATGQKVAHKGAGRQHQGRSVAGPVDRDLEPPAAGLRLRGQMKDKWCQFIIPAVGWRKMN